MNGVEVLRVTFNGSMGTLETVMKDVTQEMADFLPPNLADPIGWAYLHAVQTIDWTIHNLFLGKPLVWEAGGWGEKFGFETPGYEDDIHEWAHTHTVPLELARQYAQGVTQTANAYIDTLNDTDLNRAIEGFGEGLDTVGKVFATFINWHTAAHTGEIAALKGTQGKVGYGF